MELIAGFEALYGKTAEKPDVFFSPGRVNLIGEHTDYNGGYVFPCALDFGTTLVIRKNNLNKWRFATTNFEQRGEVECKTGLTKIDKHWYNYPLGVIDQLQKLGNEPGGCDYLYSGEIPNGAGLSSSASIETLTAFALNELYGFGLERMEMVKLSQRAENQFVGVNCGIMDQFAICMGKKDHAMFLNCATLEYQHVPLVMKGHKLIISNTNKRRGLADSKYNERRGECETAVTMLSKAGKIEVLSELSFAKFMDLKDYVKDPVVFRRASHVLSENQRVLDAIDALKANDLVLFGKLMNGSHDSLRDDYEVTGVELDTLVEEARKVEGVLGSRMTGAGFGGCTVSLVREDAVEKFKEQVGKNYTARTGLVPDFYIASVGDGTKRIQ
jgi:galactokinase